jgi:hypothetical protein
MLLTSVFCTIAAHVPYISLSSKNLEKRVTENLIVKIKSVKSHLPDWCTARARGNYWRGRPGTRLYPRSCPDQYPSIRPDRRTCHTTCFKHKIKNLQDSKQMSSLIIYLPLSSISIKISAVSLTSLRKQFQLFPINTQLRAFPEENIW